MRAKLKLMPYAVALAIGPALVSVVGCSEALDAGTQCADKVCFSEQFADCTAATYTTEKQAGGQALYRILGPSDSGCQVQLQYTANPNPAWVDKQLTMTLDADQPFEPQMKKALQGCLTKNSPGAFECKGPLRGIALASGPAKGKKQGLDWAANMPGSGAAQLPAIADDAPRRFPVEIGGQWGYIDRDGEVVIEARFDAADDFHNGLAGVNINGSFGYVNTDGEIVIKPKFYDVGAFSDGLAAVQLEDQGPLGFIDRHGKMVISTQFRAGYGSVDRTHFVDGLAPVQQSDPDPDSPYWYYGFIDKRGQWAIEPQFREVRPFSQGLAAVRKSRHSWSYINPAGEVVLEGKWSDALSFAEGLAAVETKKDGHDGWEYIDKQGKLAAAPVFGTQRNSSRPDRARSFSEGLGLVYFDGPRQWQYITATKFGDEAKFTEMKGIHAYATAAPFRGGLARVVPVYRQGDRDGDTVYIDRQGNPIWPRQNGK